jgi:hypothetical protein
MDNEKLNPKESKCFTCTYGLCMLQENTAYIEANFPMIEPTFGQNIEMEPEIAWDPEEEEEDVDEPRKIAETRVCSLCYWAPPGIKLETPIVTAATIRICSRYVKRDE